MYWNKELLVKRTDVYLGECFVGPVFQKDGREVEAQIFCQEIPNHGKREVF